MSVCRRPPPLSCRTFFRWCASYAASVKKEREAMQAVMEQRRKMTEWQRSNAPPRPQVRQK